MCTHWSDQFTSMVEDVATRGNEQGECSTLFRYGTWEEHMRCIFMKFYAYLCILMLVYAYVHINSNYFSLNVVQSWFFFFFKLCQRHYVYRLSFHSSLDLIIPKSNWFVSLLWYIPWTGTSLNFSCKWLLEYSNWWCLSKLEMIMIIIVTFR